MIYLQLFWSFFQIGLVSAINFIAVVLFLAGLFVLRKFKTNPIFIMLGCGAIGGVFYLLF